MSKFEANMIALRAALGVQSEAYNLGCDARNDFEGRSACPFDPRTQWDEGTEWLAGYDATDLEFEARELAADAAQSAAYARHPQSRRA